MGMWNACNNITYSYSTPLYLNKIGDVHYKNHKFQISCCLTEDKIVFKNYAYESNCNHITQNNLHYNLWCWGTHNINLQNFRNYMNCRSVHLILLIIYTFIYIPLGCERHLWQFWRGVTKTEGRRYSPITVLWHTKICLQWLFLDLLVRCTREASNWLGQAVTKCISLCITCY